MEQSMDGDDGSPCPAGREIVEHVCPLSLNLSLAGHLGGRPRQQISYPTNNMFALVF